MWAILSILILFKTTTSRPRAYVASSLEALIFSDGQTYTDSGREQNNITGATPSTILQLPQPKHGDVRNMTVVDHVMLYDKNAL